MKADYTDVINAAVAELGKVAYDHAKKHCPVVTGRLKRSITLTDVTSRADGNPRFKIWTNVPYAGNVEFGWRRRRPKPFLGNALEYARTQAPLVLSIFLRGSVGK